MKSSISNRWSTRPGPTVLGCLSLALLGVAWGMEAPVTPHPAAPAPPPPAAILGTAENESGTGRAEVMELKRISGDMAMLRIGIVNTGKEPMSMGSLYNAPGTGDAFTIGGVTLVDPVNKKKYFVVRDSANHCVCSNSLLEDLKPGARINVWARFPSPPEDVQKMSVLIPHFPPIDDVAVSK
jgi:hypothetical protein